MQIKLMYTYTVVFMDSVYNVATLPLAINITNYWPEQVAMY